MKSNDSFQLMEKVSRIGTWLFYGFIGSLFSVTLLLILLLSVALGIPTWFALLLALFAVFMLPTGLLVAWLVLRFKRHGTGRLTEKLVQQYGGARREADWFNLFRSSCWSGMVMNVPVTVMYAHMPRRSGLEQFVSGIYNGADILASYINSKEYWQMGRGRFASQTVRVELQGKFPRLSISGRTKLGEAAGRRLTGAATEIKLEHDAMAKAFIITSDNPAWAAQLLSSTEVRQALLMAASWCAPLLANVELRDSQIAFMGYVTSASEPERLGSLVQHLLDVNPAARS